MSSANPARRSKRNPINNSTPDNIAASAVSNRFFDFWFLGGTSLVLFVFMSIANIYRTDYSLLQQKFMMLLPLFGLLSIVCNHPHFIISYRFGYSRGLGFIFKNWIALIAVPIFLLCFYTVAYLKYSLDISDATTTIKINNFFDDLGLTFHIGENGSLGVEFLSLSIWMMYLTVGWHYSKQVYGCMMVYNKFDNYSLADVEKKIIRYSLLILAAYQFVFSSRAMDRTFSQGFQDARFSGTSMTPLGLPEWLQSVLGFSALGLFIAVAFIFLKKYLNEHKKPSPTFIVSWLSIYAWWIPFIDMPEYYFIAVPFFHSLQYLPFAYRMEEKKIAKNRWYYANLSVRVLSLLVIGFLLFEFIPSTLDLRLMGPGQSAAFFGTAIVVFINIHHFFIDSCVWRLDQKEVKNGILRTPAVTH
jgi:hypothetical protein